MKVNLEVFIVHVVAMVAVKGSSDLLEKYTILCLTHIHILRKAKPKCPH
jgi:hypothetical protein